MLYPHLAVIGVVVLAVAFFSARLRHLAVTGPLVALTVGVLVGPDVANVVNVRRSDEKHVLLIACEVAVCLSLVAIGLRFKVSEFRSQARSLTIVLFVGMTLMAITGGLLAWALTGIAVTSAFLLGAMLAPTDPVLSSSVITGKPAEQSIPERIRILVSGESAANDGLTAVIVFALLGGVLAVESASRNGIETLGTVFFAIALGTVAGLVAGKLTVFTQEHNDMDGSTFMVIALALGLTMFGVAEVVNAQAFITVLVTSLAFGSVINQKERLAENKIDEAVGQVLVLPVFVLLGTMLPWSQWANQPLATIAFVVSILLFRRLPWLLLLKRPLKLAWSEAAFVGWFGPIGVAALYYLLVVTEKAGTPDALWSFGVAVVTGSIVVHGLTAVPGRNLFARIHSRT